MELKCKLMLVLTILKFMHGFFLTHIFMEFLKTLISTKWPTQYLISPQGGRRYHLHFPEGKTVLSAYQAEKNGGWAPRLLRHQMLRHFPLWSVPLSQAPPSLAALEQQDRRTELTASSCVSTRSQISQKEFLRSLDLTPFSAGFPFASNPTAF